MNSSRNGCYPQINPRCILTFTGVHAASQLANSVCVTITRKTVTFCSNAPAGPGFKAASAETSALWWRIGSPTVSVGL
jgi:hypothetical protein